MTLEPILNILKNPSHPGYAQALAQLAAFNPATLTQPELALLLTEIESTIAHISANKSETASQLNRLRTQTQALSSYQAPSK